MNEGIGIGGINPAEGPGQQAFANDYFGRNIYQGAQVIIGWDYGEKGLGFKRATVFGIPEDGKVTVRVIMGEELTLKGVQCVLYKASV